MRRFVDVHASEVVAAVDETVLHSDATNQCLVICAYDAANKIGGLAHALFLSGRLDQKRNHPVLKDASGAIDEMVKDMVLLGAQKDKIEVCCITGENVPHRKDDPDYNKTIASAINILKDKHIKYKEDSAADAGDLHVSFDVSTGNISYD